MTEGQLGRVVQVKGAVVDVSFPPSNLPDIYHALEIPRGDGQPSLVLEVEQHIGKHWVRCVAMGATDGLERGAPVHATGGPISVPVGPGVLGRVLDVLGRPVDGKGEVQADTFYPIVLHGSKTISVPEDTAWDYHEEYVDISITTAISAGFYDLYAKIGGAIPKVISPTLHDVVEVLADIPDSEFGEISITGYIKV